MEEIKMILNGGDPNSEKENINFKKFSFVLMKEKSKRKEE
jgi:hypothetical protein